MTVFFVFFVHEQDFRTIVPLVCSIKRETPVYIPRRTRTEEKRLWKLSGHAMYVHSVLCGVASTENISHQLVFP